MTDVRDVYFQRDPFAIPGSTGEIMRLPESTAAKLRGAYRLSTGIVFALEGRAPLGVEPFNKDLMTAGLCHPMIY